MAEAYLDDSIARFYEEGVGSARLISAQHGNALVLDSAIEPRLLIRQFDPSDETDVIRQGTAENIKKLYDSISVHSQEVDGTTYDIELGVLEGTGQEVVLHDATYSSSLTNNPGNVFEQAVAHTLRPDLTHVYVGALGMGLSSPLTAKEQRYVRRTGSLIEYDPESGRPKPLPAVTALARVLHNQDLAVQHLESDSAGAVRSVALGAAFGGGNIRSSHQNVRAGIKDLHALALAKGMLIDDGKISRIHEDISPDAFKMRAAILDFTRSNVGASYLERKLQPRRSLAMYGAFLIGLTHGPNTGNPLANDNQALLRTNPGARVLITAGEHDVFSSGADTEAFLVKTTRELSGYADSEVSAAILPGIAHGPQTHYPQYLRALAETVLHR